MSADPAKVTFQVGDTVRNLQTNEQRYVVDVVGDALFVLADESKGKHSNRRQWLASNCTLVTPCPFHIHDKVVLGNKTDVVGEIVEIKPHYNGKWLMFCIQRPNPNGGTMTHWANEVALRPVETPASVGDILKETESAAEALNLDDIPAPDSVSRDLLMRAAQEVGEAHQAALAAEERAKVAELRIKKLEQIIHEHEVYAKQPQTVPSAQPVCYEIKTITHRVDLPESDTEYARLLNEGWKENHIATNITSGDAILRTITFKKMLNTPPQPTRGSAEHHIDLTSDFVRQSVETRRVTPSHQPVTITPDGVVEPVNRQPQTLGGLVRTFGADAVGAQLDKVAVEKVLARREARQAAAPIYQAFIPFKVGEQS